MKIESVMIQNVAAGSSVMGDHHSTTTGDVPVITGQGVFLVDSNGKSFYGPEPLDTPVLLVSNPEARKTGPTATVKLRIENTYELFEDQTTYVTATVALPIPDEGTDARSDWEYEYIHGHTGVGHSEGDSWYDVEIIESTDPDLIGLTFDFGY